MGRRKAGFATAAELHPAGAAPTQAYARGMRVGQHGEIAAVEHGPQEGVGGAPAPAALLVHLEVGAAEVVAVVEHLDGGNAALRGGLAPGIEDLPAHARILDTHFAAATVAIGRAMLVVFERLEDGQHVVPAPAAQPERRPVVPVAALPAHVDHGVDRRAAAEPAPARVMDRAAGEVFVGLGLVAPVGARVGDRVEVADRDRDPEIVVPAARFQQQHARIRVLRQAVREQAAGAARAHDHIVETAKVAHAAYSIYVNQQIRFCKSYDEARIAYAITGEGPPLVKAPHWLT